MDIFLECLLVMHLMVNGDMFGSQQILQGKPAGDEEPPGWRGRKKCEGLRNSWELVLPAKRIPDIDPDQKIGERGAPMIRWGPGWVRSEKRPQARQ
jgi:hypothetical protein